MSYCANCGSLLSPDALFCPDCGTAVAASAPTAPIASAESASSLYLSPYQGTQKEFPFMGRTLVISAAMDTFNHYRQEFRSHARQAVNTLTVEYCRHVLDLNTFLLNFSIMYEHCRKPLTEAAINLLPQVGVYDVPLSLFEEKHSQTFCLCGNDLKMMTDCFVATVSANTHGKIQAYNTLPFLVFRGIGGFTNTAPANYATANALDTTLRNARITPEQQNELFSRLNPSLLMEHAYQDYRHTASTLAYFMNSHGLDVWYPNAESVRQAEGLFQNMCAQKLPEEKMPDVILDILQANPYSGNYFKYLNWKYAGLEEINAINNYFGFNGTDL